MITSYMITNNGGRPVNEDSARIKENADKHCYILCDGLGGHGKGEVASQFVVESIKNDFDEHSNIDVFLEQSAIKAQDGLMKEQLRLNARNEMKTTLVSLMIDGYNAKWLHVGDSRLYAFAKNKVKERTIDHSVPQMLVVSGEIKEKDIRNHPDRSRLLKVMGINWESPMYTVTDIKNLTKYQAFLMCSDGFWELITEKEMCKLLKKSKNVEEWLLEMEKVVNKNGVGKNMDNYTAIAVWC